MSLSILKKQAADKNNSFDSRTPPVILAPIHPITSVGQKTNNHKSVLTKIFDGSNVKEDASFEVGNARQQPDRKVSNFNLSNGIENRTALREKSASQRSVKYTMNSESNNQPELWNDNAAQTNVPERNIVSTAEEGVADHLGNFDCMKIIQLIDSILIQTSKQMNAEMLENSFGFHTGRGVGGLDQFLIHTQDTTRRDNQNTARPMSFSSSTQDLTTDSNRYPVIHGGSTNFSSRIQGEPNHVLTGRRHMQIMKSNGFDSQRVN